MCKPHQLLWLIATRGSESQRLQGYDPSIAQFLGFNWRTFNSIQFKPAISVHGGEMAFEMVWSVSLRSFIRPSTATITLEMKLDDDFFVTSSLYLKDLKKLLQHLKIILYSELFNH